MRLNVWGEQAFTVPELELRAIFKAHRVTVHVQRPAPPEMVSRHAWTASPAVTLASRVRGVATAEGLPIMPEAWRRRKYRRALQGNPGVYQVGLWAMLFLAGRPVVDVLADSRPVAGMNSMRLLVRYITAYLPPVRSGIPIREMTTTERIAYIQSLRRMKPFATDSDSVAFHEAFHAALRSTGAYASYARAVVPTGGEAQGAASTVLNLRAAAIQDRAARRAFRREAREFLRALRRMLPRRPVLCPAPRIRLPFYARPQPPTAPTAPPLI